MVVTLQVKRRTCHHHPTSRRLPAFSYYPHHHHHFSRTGGSSFPPLRPGRHHPGKTSARLRRVPTRLDRGCRHLSRAAWKRATLSVPFAVIRTGTSLKNRLARHSASLSDCSGRRAPVFDGSPLVLLPSSAGLARGRRARRFIRLMSSLTFSMHVTTLTCRW